MYASYRHTILLSLFITKEQRMTFDYFQKENFEFAELAEKSWLNISLVKPKCVIYFSKHYVLYCK